MPGPRPPATDVVEAVVRGWVTLIGILLSLTLPVVETGRLDDADGEPAAEDPRTWWGVAYAAFLDDDSPVDDDSTLLVLRVLVVFLALGLGIAGWVALAWTDAGALDAVPGRLRLACVWVLVAAVVVMTLLAGGGAGSGLWAYLFTAFAVGAPRASTGWPRLSRD